MADIKTRDTVKGTIKTLDKAAIAGQKMKQAYIATKDKAEHSVNTNENMLPIRRKPELMKSHIKVRMLLIKLDEKAFRKQSRIFNLPKRAYSVSNSREQKRQ